MTTDTANARHRFIGDRAMLCAWACFVVSVSPSLWSLMSGKAPPGTLVLIEGLVLVSTIIGGASFPFRVGWGRLIRYCSASIALGIIIRLVLRLA